MTRARHLDQPPTNENQLTGRPLLFWDDMCVASAATVCVCLLATDGSNWQDACTYVKHGSTFCDLWLAGVPKFHFPVMLQYIVKSTTTYTATWQQWPFCKDWLQTQLLRCSMSGHTYRADMVYRCNNYVRAQQHHDQSKCTPHF